MKKVFFNSSTAYHLIDDATPQIRLEEATRPITIEWSVMEGKN